MKRSQLSLPQIPAMELSITRTQLDAASPLNQNDPHIHAECEIYINLSGNVAFSVEDRLYNVTRGSVIITMPYEYHHCIYRSQDLHDHYWITFTADPKHPFLAPFFRREKGVDNHILLDEGQLISLCGLLDAMTETDSPTEQSILALQMFRYLMAGKRSDPGARSNKLPQDVANALAYMEQHLREEFPISALAGACNVSVNTLERHFRTYLGTTPFLMLRNKRLFTSMMYLRSGSSVTEAAMKSGFPDYSNFIQIFRRQFGLTPGQYKKNWC